MKISGEFLLSDDHAGVDILLGDAIRKIELGSVTDALKALDLFWARLAMHIRAEHLHLFPATLRISENDGVFPEGDVAETLEQLRRDHDYFMHELADSIKAMRSITSANERQIRQLTTGRLQAIKIRLADHNAIEEDRIYPLHRFLSAGDNELLRRSITRELNNLPPRLIKGK